MNEIDKLLNMPEIVKEFDLKDTVDVLKKLGNPENGLKYIHVAGTNGKGSVCAMTAKALQLSGKKTGLYTSPHLSKINERISVNGVSISDDDLNRIIALVRKQSEKITFFEILTICAFVYFHEQDVDFVVLETGMGGRLDATNVISAEVSVITNISYDHTQHLGFTIHDIACEKAGIIKESGTVITGSSNSALQVIRSRCMEKNAKLILPKENMSKEKMFDLGIKGDFQQENASLANAALLQLGIDEKIILDSFREVRWPGRFEFFDNVVIDGAHNIAAIEMLVREIKKVPHKKLILVVGVLKDKDVSTFAQMLSPLADHVIATSPKTYRANPTEVVAKYFRAAEEISDVKEAVRHAKLVAEKDDLVLVTGSLYTIAEAREYLA